jgi:hypothetical protein
VISGDDISMKLVWQKERRVDTQEKDEQFHQLLIRGII